MARFSVLCRYRADGGMSYSKPTHERRVTVEAADAADARSAAIAEVYRVAAADGGQCSHVRPVSVAAA